MNTKQIWQAALGDLQLQIPRSEFDTWIKETTLIDLEDNQAIIGTSNIFAREKLEGRYVTPIRSTLQAILGYPVQVQIVIGSSNDAAPVTVSSARSYRAVGADDRSTVAVSNERATSRAVNGSQSATALAQQLELPTPRTAMLNPRYTFGSYIVGSSNRLAHAACLAVAEHPAKAYNPLVLYGGVGLGKTHLLHAIGNHAIDSNPEVNVMYVSSEKFTTDLINAIRRQQNEEFRIRYRNIDVLLIDDIQFIAGKEGTQEEFFHTFNALHSAGKQIVISSDRPPKAILTLEERLRSRFEWGLIVDVQTPDVETRTAILRTKAETMSTHIPADVIDFLAHRIQSNIRELEGCLNRVVAYAQLTGSAVSIDTATGALTELLDTSRRKRITPDAIIKETAEFYGVDSRALQGRGRSRDVPDARRNRCKLDGNWPLPRRA